MDSIKDRPAKAVFSALCRFSNKKTGLCYPSYKTISRVTLYGESAIKAGISYLIENNIIKVIRNAGKVNHYSILPKLSTGSESSCIKKKTTYPQTYPQARGGDVGTQSLCDPHPVTMRPTPSHYVTPNNTKNNTKNSINKETTANRKSKDCSSSSFLLNSSKKKKEKKAARDDAELLSWWDRKGTSMLNPIGFTEDSLHQLARNSKLSNKDLISSLEDYVIYLNYDKRAERIGNKAGYIMKILRVEGLKFTAPSAAKRQAAIEMRSMGKAKGMLKTKA